MDFPQASWEEKEEKSFSSLKKGERGEVRLGNIFVLKEKERNSNYMENKKWAKEEKIRKD